MALIAVVMVGLGTTTANAVGEDPPAAPTAGSEITEDRGAAAERADRSDREEPAGDGERADQQARTQEAKAKPPEWVHPMPDAATTSCFGFRWGSQHAGVDLASPPGTPIHTVGDGTVAEAGWVYGGYGISVVIDHGDGYFTHYAHASEAKVSKGDTVDTGDVIALEGNTGHSNGPHLHFEVHKGMWNQVEPTQWLSNRGVDVPGC